MKLYTYTCRNILNTITTSKDKVLCVRGSWWLNKDCNISTSPAPPDIAVCLSRSPGLLNRGPGAQFVLTARSRTLLQVLNCNCSIGSPDGPLCWVLFSLQHPSPTDLNFLCTELYYCFTLTQSLPITGLRNMQLPPSLEWHVWSSSSGNNCHAVHRSPSSGASVCDCTVGF